MHRSHSHIIIAAVFLSTLLTACVKHGDDNIGMSQNQGVAFPLGENARNDFKLIPSSSPQTVPGLLFVKLNSFLPANADIHVHISDNTLSLVSAYNTANGTSIQPLPSSLYHFPSELLIRKSEQNAEADITVTNTVGLNYNSLYAIGINIVDAGTTQVAANLRSLFIVFTVQNQYDGVFTMKGQYYNPTLEPGFAHHNLKIELHTSGPNTVKIYWPYASQYVMPLTTNGGQPFLFPGFQTLQPEIYVKPVSNDSAFINNTAPGSTVIFEPILTYNSNTYTNRWDGASKTIYMATGYNLGAGGTITPSSRAWLDTLIWTGPR